MQINLRQESFCTQAAHSNQVRQEWSAVFRNSWQGSYFRDHDKNKKMKLHHERRGVILSLQADLFTRFSEKHWKQDHFCVVHFSFFFFLLLPHDHVFAAVPVCPVWCGFTTAEIWPALCQHWLCHAGAFHQKVLTPYRLFSHPVLCPHIPLRHQWRL